MQSVLFLAFKSHTGTAHFGHAERDVYKRQAGKEAGFELLNSLGEKVKIYLDASEGRVVMDLSLIHISLYLALPTGYITVRSIKSDNCIFTVACAVMFIHNGTSRKDMPQRCV